MANCGCKPCKKPIDKVRKCKPFAYCVGNKSLVWDGECLSLLDRQYKIPDGTFTSITFKDGCIVDVGLAPIPRYTPQACCDKEVEDVGNGGNGSNNLTLSKKKTNIATLENDILDVSPVWGNSKSILVKGNGTADSAWVPEVKISNTKGNKLSVVNDGLLAEMYITTSDNVKVEGEGTKAKPYKFIIEGADAKFPMINKTKVEGPGFEIDEFGRMVLTGDPISIVSNVKFSSPSFTITNAGPHTQIDIDVEKFRKELNLFATNGIKGNGDKDAPFTLDLEDDNIEDIIALVAKSEDLQEDFKGALAISTSEGVTGKGTNQEPIKLDLRIGLGLSGKGTNAEPLVVNVNDNLLNAFFTLIENNEAHKKKLKQILGV